MHVRCADSGGVADGLRGVFVGVFCTGAVLSSVDLLFI